MAELEPKPGEEAPKKLTTKQNIIQVLKFALFSMSAGIIQLVVSELLLKLTDLRYTWCYLPALILSVVYNFTVNRRYTFKSANNVPVAMLKVAIYYVIFTPLSTWAGDSLVANGANEDLVLIVTMLINGLTEFLVCRFWVFRKSINTNDLAKKEEEAAAKKAEEQETSSK